MLTHYLLLFVGLVVLVVGADSLIRGASNVAKHFGISALVVGLTVVAFGTSAPELFVSVAAAFRGSADVAVGNVLGSNLFNILVIVGITSLLAPVEIGKAVIHREMPIMLAVLGAFLFVSWDLTITRVEGIALFSGLLGYLYLNYWLVKRGRVKLEEIEAGLEEAKSSESPNMFKQATFIILGLAGLVYGADLIVTNAVVIAKSLGVSDLIIGITLVAAGTSLPELATTVVAAWKGEPDLAIGNAVGSNVFNVLCVIGLTSVVTPLSVNPIARGFDLPYMFIACFLVWPLMYWRRTLRKLDGIFMLAGYAVYLVLLFAVFGGAVGV